MNDFRRRTLRLRMLIPIILALLYLGPSMVMPYVWIDLRAVAVTDATDAMRARVHADRVTHIGFPGRFVVSFREADGVPVCAPYVSPVIQYKGGLSTPIDKPLWWWAGGLRTLRDCIEEGLADGVFYTLTCHQAMMWWTVPIAQRCVRSNEFRLGAAR